MRKSMAEHVSSLQKPTPKKPHCHPPPPQKKIYDWAPFKKPMSGAPRQKPITAKSAFL